MASIQGVYVALFGRPADPLGLAFYNTATKNGADLTAIGDLASTTEYQNRFAGQTNTQIVNSIYRSLFNRDADLAGLTFFAAALAAGTLNIKNIAIAIFDGAQGSDITVRDTKVASANLFTASLDTGTEVVAYQGIPAANAGVAFLTPINTTVATQAQVDASIAQIVANAGSGGGVVGVTLGLTVNDDIIGPNSATAATKSTANDDSVISTTAANFNAGDIIDLGAGNDTLKAVVAANIKPTLTGIETVQIQFTGANTLDLSGSTGIKTLVADASTAAGTFDKVALGTAVTVSNQAFGATVNFNAVTGTTDSASITASKVTAGAIIANGIETLNLTSTGGANTLALTSNTAETVNISGTAALTLDLQGNAATIKTVTSTSSAAVTIDLSTALTENVSVTLGAGADTLDVTGAAKKVTAVLGDGADTINFDGGKASVVTGGAAADTFNLKVDGGALGLAAGDITTAAKLAAAAIVITDFSTGSDKLNIDAAAATISTLTGTQLATVASQTDILLAANKALELSAAAAAAETIKFTFGSDTYFIVNNNADDVVSTGDALIKLTGVTNVVAGDFTVA